MRQSTAHYGPTMGSDYFLRQYNNENRAGPRDLDGTAAAVFPSRAEGRAAPAGRAFVGAADRCGAGALAR